jgi:peptide deformylase
MDFVSYPDPRLTQKAKPAPVDDNLLAIGERLRTACASVQAYGLAAVHIGEIAPVVVMNLMPEGARQDVLLFNPRVIAIADENEVGTEGSVSMPGVQVDISRPVWAQIAFADETGIERRQRFDGFLARVALHEIDQMNGIWFLSHLSRLKRDIVVKKFLKAQRG